MSELHRLVYTSVRKPECSDTEIKKILESCKRNNPKRNITGVLVHSDSRFLQYVEGDKKELLELYELIKTDERHAGSQIRCFDPIDERVFATWEMGYRNLNDIRFHTNVTRENQLEIEELLVGTDFTDKGLKILKLFFRI